MSNILGEEGKIKRVRSLRYSKDLRTHTQGSVVFFMQLSQYNT